MAAVDEPTIKAYIENQKWGEDDHGFKNLAGPPSLEPGYQPGFFGRQGKCRSTRRI
jgi:hypothetical protein